MNAVEDGQVMNHTDHSPEPGEVGKEPALKNSEEVSFAAELDSLNESDSKVREPSGFDGGTQDTSSSSTGFRTTNGEDDSSQSLPNGLQNGPIVDEEDYTVEGVDHKGDDLSGRVDFNDYNAEDAADLKEHSEGSAAPYSNNDNAEFEKSDSEHMVHYEDDTTDEATTHDLGADRDLKENREGVRDDADLKDGEEEDVREDSSNGNLPGDISEVDSTQDISEEVPIAEDGEPIESEELSTPEKEGRSHDSPPKWSYDAEEKQQNSSNSTEGDTIANVGEDATNIIGDSDGVRAEEDETPMEENAKNISSEGDISHIAEEEKSKDGSGEGLSIKEDSNSVSIDAYHDESCEADAQAEAEKDDEDPDALTIDTGRWSAGSSPRRAEDAKRIEEVPAAPISQPPSDDDVDPDALTIDTPPLEEAKPKFVAKPLKISEQLNGNPPLGSLKLTIPLINKVKKAAAKKAGKNAARLAKGIKKRVPRVPPPAALRCPRCPHSSFTTVTALLDHQRCCGTFSIPAPAPSAPDVPKAPRKVYMCSACGSYFENWNLFLHMKEMHKRNICLHCLGMFSQASKLTQHLATKHGVVDQVLEYGDQLAQRYPGPQFLLCIRCDRMCTDQDFESHSCSSVCSHCGLAGTHYPTCRLAPPHPVKAPKTPRRRARAPKKTRKPYTAPPPLQHTPELLPEAPSPADELSPNTYNERMLQLYRGAKQPERSFSTLESIEESINRVVESLTPPREEMDTSVSCPQPEESVLEEADDPEPMDEAPPSPPRAPTPAPAPSPPPAPPQIKSESESSDSEKLTINLEPRRRAEYRPVKVSPRPEPVEDPDALQLAGDDTPYTCVPLPEPLVTARVPTAMKLFLRATALTCVYCAHARKIAVNAKQLALHQLAQHRYVTVAESTPALEKIACHSVVVRAVREVIPSLENVFFNAYGFDSTDKSAWRSADRVYECFHCSYITPDLREFTSHNRKIHHNDLRKTRQNESHLCIMCKTRFLTYSELLCHLCRGVYVSGRIIDPHCQYRCYACDIEPLPSSFRLMVHLRQTHTACDMCFTLCDSQTALSSHVLKHKSLFYCYACALTYETRVELSKHIFWKHGAESVTCKKCLQKKWKHSYHFCLPPVGFACDTCGGWFKTAATLRVHARLHAGQFPHPCPECEEKFISRKLLIKHAVTHAALPPPPPLVVNGTSPAGLTSPEPKKKQKKSKKDLRDLFDLPPVNLSESDDSSGDEQPNPAKEEVIREEGEIFAEPMPESAPAAVAGPSTEAASVTVWDGVLASLEEKAQGRSYPVDSPFHNLPLHRVTAIMLSDHDYCRPVVAVKEDSRVGLDHDYCNNGMVRKPLESGKLGKRGRNRSSSSDSSSSSGSSSCSSSSNSSSSSTSSTESASSGEPRMQRKKKGETKSDKRKGKVAVKAAPEPEPSVDVCDVRIHESDLETDEVVTDDEQFYELNPALRASEVLKHNRSMLLDKLEGVPSPGQPSPEPRRKEKSKKKRSSHGQRVREKHSSHGPRAYSSPYATASYTDEGSNVGDSDGRRPRRKRVPLKFYGFSSGEEEEMAMAQPRKRERVVEHNTTTAASPPARAPSPIPEPSNLWNPPAWRPPPVPPRVHPIKIRTGSLKQTFAKSVNSDQFHIKRAELGGFHVNGASAAAAAEKNEKLYCFCQCPYDEVSEMIACDALDCVIEWFHFECVGINDPPKGKWFCPDCKKKAAAESEMMSIPLR